MKEKAEKMLNFLDKNAVKYCIKDGKFVFDETNERDDFFASLIERDNLEHEILVLLRERESENEPQETEKQLKLDWKYKKEKLQPSQVYNIIIDWLLEYGTRQEHLPVDLNFQMITEQLRRKGVKCDDFELRICLRELVAQGYLVREYKKIEPMCRADYWFSPKNLRCYEA